MGNSISQTLNFARNPSRKRKILCYGSDENAPDDYDSSPKRRKLMCTTKYIYKTLFEEGQGSDVKIVALNKEWNLHRVYLSQSPYFNSMFNGIWVETTQKEINIGIEDENITTAALHKVFGSLYQDEIQIEPSEAVSILASATLLQLEDLIQQTSEVMKDSINISTALSFYEASELYGLREVRNISLDWLHKNAILKLSGAQPSQLTKISVELMVELLSSPELIVVQTEFSLYLMLKLWVFLKENPNFGNYDSVLQSSEDYFKSFRGGTPFLLTNYGLSYQPAFRALRLQHLITHHVDITVIDTDNIIPNDWFFPIYKLQWFHMLKVQQGSDKGPKQVSEEEFKRNCYRCGRILNTDTQNSWRWTGFNFDFDIVIFYSRGVFKLRRYKKLWQDSNTISVQSILNHRDERYLMFRLNVYSIDNDGKVLSKIESPIKTVSLSKNEETYVINIPTAMRFPVIISANFLLTTPLKNWDATNGCIKLDDESSS